MVLELGEKVSVGDALEGQELRNVRSHVDSLSQVIEAQSRALDDMKQTTEKLTPLLPLSDLDAEELMSKAAYIIVDEKLKHIETVANTAKSTADEAKKVAQDIRMIYIFIIVLFAVFLAISLLTG